MHRLALACVLAILLPRAVAAEDPPSAPSEPPQDPPSEPAAQPTSESPAAQLPLEPTRVVPSREIVVDVPGERALENKLLVGGLIAAGLLGSGLGVYWHLDSRDAADAVSADEITGEAWTQRHVDLVERASRSKTRATIAYSIGGAFLIGAIVTYILTEPKGERTVIRTGVSVAPSEGGGTIVSRMWSF